MPSLAFFRKWRGQPGACPHGRHQDKVRPTSRFVRAGGTVVGSMVTEGDAVVDVDADVSKRHARIWLDGGKWYIQDLKSTNGTYLIRGDSKAECPVAGEPVELFASDTICLGATTCFMVWDVAP